METGKWIQNKIRTDATLCADDAGVEYKNLRSAIPEIETYDNLTNGYDLEINWSRVKIVTNNNISETEKHH